MSTTYSQFPNTNFPDRVDTIPLFEDVSPETYPLAQAFYALYDAGDIAGAQAYLAAHPALKKSYIGASTLNPIVDAVQAIQQFYMDDVQQYIMSVVKDRGEWSPGTKYLKFNVVTRTLNGAKEHYMCSDSAIPIGTEVTNTTYWISLTIRGQQGVPGSNLTAFGPWVNSTNYPSNALVSYNNALWGSKISNLGITPTISATTTWYIVIDYSSNDITYTDQGNSKTRKIVIENNRIYLEEV